MTSMRDFVAPVVAFLRTPVRLPGSKGLADLPPLNYLDDLRSPVDSAIAGLRGAPTGAVALGVALALGTIIVAHVIATSVVGSADVSVRAAQQRAQAAAVKRERIEDQLDTKIASIERYGPLIRRTRASGRRTADTLAAVGNVIAPQRTWFDNVDIRNSAAGAIVKIDGGSRDVADANLLVHRLAEAGYGVAPASYRATRGRSAYLQYSIVVTKAERP